MKSTEQTGASLALSHGGDAAAETTVKSIETLAKECRSTVKAYQEEIDNLTRRCKFSDSSFLNLYQALYDLPDPAAVLRPVLDQADASDGQIQHLLRGMEEMHSEMEEMKRKFTAQTDLLKKELAEAKKNAAKTNEEGGGGNGGGMGGGGLNKAEREELIQLRREVAEYEVEFRSLKNQDITIRKLEAKIVELEKNSRDEIEKELQKAQEELAETEGRRAAEALEREAAMERRLQSLELELRAERAGREATQTHLLEADEGVGQLEAAWEAQRQILVDDAERLRETLHEATRERDELRLRVAALVGRSQEGGVASKGLGGSPMSGGSLPPAPSSAGIGMAEMLLERKAYEAEVSELSHTVTSLREELQVKEDAYADERRKLQSTIDSLERDRNALSAKVASLESQLANTPSQASLDKMKRELRILKRLEYNAVDADADRDPEMTTGGEVGEGDDLESVLVAKLRKMETDLVRERNEKLERSKECEELKKNAASIEAAKVEAENLVASLEADLQKAIASTAVSPAMSRANSVPFQTESDPATLQRILDPTAPSPPPTNGPAVMEDSAATFTMSTSSTEKASDDHSVATIVMAQRDRLRARCEALEAERDSFKRELQIQVQSAESLKADNMKLYEKVRYLQSFNANSTSGGGYSRNRSIMSDRDLDLEALEQRYEASVDPFRQFSRAERQRKLKEMSPMERVVFIVAKTVLGSKEMRTALFFYVLGMHLLVFITTYHWSHELECHDLHLNENLAHMHGGAPLPEVPQPSLQNAEPGEG